MVSLFQLLVSSNEATMILRRRPAALAVMSVLLAATSSILAATTASATTTYHRYVALGDSYASVGTLIFPQPGSPLECARDADNYPSDVAATVKPATFVDASCGGAVTGDMTT